MSETEDDTRIIPDPTILDPFGIRAVSYQIQNKQEVKSKRDEPEFDDTGESLLYMMDRECSDYPNGSLIEYLKPR